MWESCFLEETSAIKRNWGFSPQNRLLPVMLLLCENPRKISVPAGNRAVFTSSFGCQMSQSLLLKNEGPSRSVAHEHAGWPRPGVAAMCPLNHLPTCASGVPVRPAALHLGTAQPATFLPACAVLRPSGSGLQGAVKAVSLLS